MSSFLVRQVIWCHEILLLRLKWMSCYSNPSYQLNMGELYFIILCHNEINLKWYVTATMGSKNGKGEVYAKACPYVSWFGQASQFNARGFSEWHCRGGISFYCVNYYAPSVPIGSLSAVMAFWIWRYHARVYGKPLSSVAWRRGFCLSKSFII